MPILYVRYFDPSKIQIDKKNLITIQEKSDEHIGFIGCFTENSAAKFIATSPNDLVFAIEVRKQIYDQVISVEQIAKNLYTHYCFYLPPEEFKIIGFFILSNNMVYTDSTRKFIQIDKKRLIFLNHVHPDNGVSVLKTFLEDKITQKQFLDFVYNLSPMPILSEEVIKLVYFVQNNNRNTITNFFALYKDQLFKNSLTPQEKIELLQMLESRHSIYLLAMLYDDFTSPVYDPDKAFEYLQNCSDYFPAQKAILVKYIAASFNLRGQIENPHAYALAQQTAENILAKEPENEEAKAFLERQTRFVSSIKITEEFNSIIGKPMKSMMFFKDLTKKMQLKMLEDGKARGDAYYQHEFDKRYGLILR